MKHSIKISILMVIAIISTSNLFAATRTWDGSSSTAWNTGANWSGNSVPASGDDVIIPSGLSRYPVLSANVRVRTFTQNGGTFTSNNFELRADNALIINGGTFDAGSGLIKTTNGDIDITNGSLTVQYNKIETSTGDKLIVDGGSVSITGNGIIIFQGDLELISGSIDFNFNNINVGDRLVFSDATLIDMGDTFDVGRLDLDFTGTKTLSNVITVAGEVRFKSGILNTSINEIVIFQYASFVATSSGNFPTDTKHINGPAIKLISSSATTDFTFPIGDGTYYAPIRIAQYGNRRNGDYFKARYFSSRNSNAGGTLGSGLSLVSQAEYWLLDRDALSGTPTTTAAVTLSYNTTRSGSITDAALLKVARWNGSQWVDHGRGSASTSNNTSGTIITSSNVTGFSPFTLGSSSNVNPLPVHLLNFNAVAVASNVNVKWTTTSEINNDFFNVEKSLDGKNWSVIGAVKGAGNTESLTNYNFVDANPVMGIQYYRLKQTDINGQYTYSSIAPVNFANTLTSTINIFPIPANNFINVELPGATEMLVTIYNANGQKVFESTSGSLLNIDIQDFNAGLYTVEVKADNNVSSSKFLKN